MKINLPDWLRGLVERWWTCSSCGCVNEDSRSHCSSCKVYKG
ncbi:MAG TPA: hypothetical protein VGL94_09875 [Ktedonobacteraceae bacterium]